MQELDSHFDRIIEAEKAVTLAQKKLQDAVTQAREAGATWQQVGSALGISKQAASQRFHDSSRIYNARDMTQIQKELEQIADELFAALSHNDIDRVHQLMTYTATRLLSKRKIDKLWQAVLETSGAHIELLHSVVEHSVVEHSGADYILTYRLRHERGEPVGQISFNTRKQITGLVIFNDDSAELPW